MRRAIPSGIQNGVTKDSWASPEPILGFVEKGAHCPSKIPHSSSFWEGQWPTLVRRWAGNNREWFVRQCRGQMATSPRSNWPQTDFPQLFQSHFPPAAAPVDQAHSTPRGQHLDDIQRQRPDDWMRIQVPSWDVNLCREKDNNGGNQFRVTEHYVPRWTRTMLGQHCWFRPQNFVFEYQDLMRYCDLPKFNSHLHLIILSKVSFSELFQHYFIYLIVNLLATDFLWVSNKNLFIPWYYWKTRQRRDCT